MLENYALKYSTTVYPMYSGLHELERILIEYVDQYPGIRYRELLRMTNSSNGVLSYHLTELEKLNLIRAVRRKSMTRYYLINVPSEIAKVIAFTKSSTSRQILSFLVNNGPVTFYEICKTTQRCQSTIFWHLKRMLGENVIIKTQPRRDSNIINRPTCYDVDDRELVSEVLKAQKETFSDRVVNNYSQIFDELT
jgi:predicted transcriptional regulator